MNKKNFVFLVVGIVVLGVIGWIAWPDDKNGVTAGDSADAVVQGALDSDEKAYDFGTISMAAGNVRHTFAIQNKGEGSVAISKVFTSCMCTEATLIRGDVRAGPFGMPGHGSVPSINESLAPGEKAEIEVVFDPAAHGPSGLGRVERVIFIEKAGERKPFELRFVATVTP